MSIVINGVTTYFVGNYYEVTDPLIGSGQVGISAKYYGVYPDSSTPFAAHRVEGQAINESHD